LILSNLSAQPIKRTVQLEDQLKAPEMEAQQSQSYLQDLQQSELNCLEHHLSGNIDLANNLLGIKREHLLKEKHQVKIQSQLKKSIQVLEKKLILGRKKGLMPRNR